MPSDQSTDEGSGEAARDSISNRVIMRLPDPPHFKASEGFWAFFGAAHGAWIIAYTSLPEVYTIWGFVALAVFMQLVQ